MPASAIASAPDMAGKPASHQSLTSRQRTVLKLMSQGKANKEIANQLGISEITVKAHVSAILKKLDANNRVQAALMAEEILGEEALGGEDQ